MTEAKKPKKALFLKLLLRGGVIFLIGGSLGIFFLINQSRGNIKDSINFLESFQFSKIEFQRNLQDFKTDWQKWQKDVQILLAKQSLGARIKYLYFLPQFKKESELKSNLLTIIKSGEQIADGSVFKMMLNQEETLSFWENFKKSLAYFDRYGINYFKDWHYHLDNWLSFFGVKQNKNYLVVFQDPSLPRPSGGLIEAYAILSLNQGKVSLEGGSILDLKDAFLENIVPPLPLQTISNKWFFHDVNWFFDFPLTAQKTMAFYPATGEKEKLSGVIFVNLDFLREIIKITGPIEVKEYNLILDENNFLSLFAQKTRESFKQVSATPSQEFFVFFLKALEEKMKTLPASALQPFPEIVMSAFNKKDIQLYNKEDGEEYYFDAFNWTGRLEESRGDYLGVAFSLLNKDFSADRREKRLKLITDISSGVKATTTLSISLSPEAVKEEDQELYLKIYLPQEAEIIEAKGGYLKNLNSKSWPYEKLGYKKDEDVFSIEATLKKFPGQGIETYEESGKKVVGTWVRLGRSSFDLIYERPVGFDELNSWELRVQKQSGQNNKFFYQLILPTGVKIAPTLFSFGQWLPLEKDLEINFNIER
ncbi:MAG: DUF4012 domain-containing protein [Candidatus Pacebacteria bacterium]|nr:DUF4012 domain-containing protein [Candidatus Paceibacterota bacterium]